MLQPFVRYAAQANIFPNNTFVKSYDARFLYVLKSYLVVDFCDKSYTVKENSLAYYPPGTMYFPHCTDNSNISYITVNFDFTQDYAHLTNVLAPVHVNNFSPDKALNTFPEKTLFANKFIAEHAENIREPFLRMAYEYNNPSRYSREKANTFLQEVLYTLLSGGANLKRNHIVSEIKNFVSENLANPIDNISLATHCGYNPTYLNRLFREETGITLHRYIMECRLYRAKELIQTTDMSIQEIAYSVGFCNPNHFSKRFTDFFTITPTSCRNQIMYI